jgi:hypothetical protein
MNAQLAALPDKKLIHPTEAQLIDQLRTLFALEAMSSIRAGEFSTKVEPTAKMNPLNENDGYAGARRASLLEIDNEQHELTDEHGLLGRCLLQSRGTNIE